MIDIRKRASKQCSNKKDIRVFSLRNDLFAIFVYIIVRDLLKMLNFKAQLEN